MRRLKTVRRPPIYPKTPGHLPCSSLTHPLPLSSRRPSVSFGGFGLNAKGAIGGLVQAYTTRDDSGEEWLESWFTRRTELHFASSIPADEQVTPITLAPTHVLQPSQRPGLRLVSIRPHYFRGFKALPDPIALTGALVVIEGKNSSGKTSLAEALEFLFRGSLSRREEHGEGNPEELENCIENLLRPKGESTYVEATFVKHSGTPDEKQLVLSPNPPKDVLGDSP